MIKNLLIAQKKTINAYRLSDEDHLTLLTDYQMKIV